MQHDNEEYLVRMFILSETDKAYLVTNDNGNIGNIPEVKCWLPKSQMRRVSKQETEALTQITFSLPEWLVKKNNLWDFAK